MAWNIALTRGSVALGSLRFNGNLAATGSFVDRAVKQSLSTSSANVGGADFCLDVWLNASSSNTAAAITSGANYNWINGNIFYDRDRYDKGRAWGLSLGAGRVVFGLKNTGETVATFSTTTDIRGDGWTHVRVQRAVSSGSVQIYINGTREVNDTGPTGTISCPDTGNTEPWDPYLVIGAEKHDADVLAYPSYYGYMTELLLRNTIPSTGTTITVPTAPFANSIANGVSLWHFAEGTGLVLNDSIGNTPLDLLVGGTPTQYPQWSSESPFT